YREDGREQLLDGRYPNYLVRLRGDLVIPICRHRDHDAGTRADFFHIGADLFVDAVLQRDRDDGQVLVDERIRPVLHLAGGGPLSVNVRKLLQLERALEGSRIVHAAAEEEEVARGVVPVRERAYLWLLLQHGVHERRQVEGLRE